jgi:hypothetical protein
MRKMFLLLMSAFPILTLQAQSGHTPPYITKSLTGAGIRQVEAETSGGNIYIASVSDGEARLEVYVQADNNRNDQDLPKDEIKKRLEEQYDLTISSDGGKLTALAKQKRSFNNWKRGLSISFKIYVPQAVSTNLRTSGGNIALKNLSGTEDFRTSGGNLDIDQLSGHITGRTSGGNINLSDSKEDLDLSTSGGNIEATNCSGNMRLVTSGGNLRLKLLNGTIHSSTSGGTVTGEEITGELQTHTSGGNIRLRDMACSLGASTSGGDIDVTVKTLGKYLDLTNSSGNISLELPQDKGIDLRVYAERIRTNTLNNFKGDSDERHLEGTLNGGGIPVKLDDNGGRVSLTFR